MSWLSNLSSGGSRVWNGKVLRWFAQRLAPNAGNLLSVSDMNELVAGLNALTTAEIKLDDRFEVIITEAKTVYLIDKNALKDLLCPRRMRIKANNGDYYTCREWDGTLEGGTDIYVAKPITLRNSLASEVIVEGALSLTCAYTYSAADKRTMHVSASTSGTWLDEVHYVRPQVVINGTRNGVAGYYSEIWAMPITGPAKTGVKVGAFDVEWIDLNYDGRAWSQVPIDPTP